MKFSIISPDYESHVPREGKVNINRGLKSILNQSFDDFEILVCHDGPASSDYHKGFHKEIIDDSRVKFIHTPQHMGNFGHHSRDFAMRQANGEYFIQFNPDNYFYEGALEKIANKLDNSPEDIVIFAVTHAKWPIVPLMYGIPPKEFGIDCMQLVAHSNIWNDMGYWTDFSHNGDGKIYEAMCNKHRWTFIPECLGENY